MQITVTCVSGLPASHDWWPIIVGGLEFVIGLGLTIYTFRKTFKQKSEERRASWYHKVVVDKSIELLFAYMDSERNAIEQSALSCEIARGDETLSPTAVEARYAAALTEFQCRLRPVRSELTNLALIFDRRLFDRIQTVTLTLDDRISEWFYAARTSGALRVPKMVSEIMSDFHHDVLTTLRDYEFGMLSKQR